MPEAKWGSVREAAAWYGVSTDSIRNWIKLGSIDARRIGPKLIRIRLVDIADAEKVTG